MPDYRAYIVGIDGHFNSTITEFLHNHPDDTTAIEAAKHFRTEAGPMLDDLLSRSVAGLIASGIVDLQTMAVDGMRLQAAASGASFRSGDRLDELSEAAAMAVRQLRAELDDDPTAASRRVKARRLSAAEDRARRLEEARKAYGEVEERRKKTWGAHKPARASTTDPQARFMKMSDGGFRPAYNVQIKTAAAGAHIVGISVTARGTDHGELGPALREVEERYGLRPRQMLADGGFESGADVEMLHAQGIDLFSPPRRTKDGPVASRPSDGPGMTAWRRSRDRQSTVVVSQLNAPMPICAIVDCGG
jgi:hypothetical protein